MGGTVLHYQVLSAHSLVGPFLEPVNVAEVAGYAKVVTRPMDLSAVRRRLYNYDHHSAFAEDVRLIWRNCLAFNHHNSFLSRSAGTLSAFFEELYYAWIVGPEEDERARRRKTTLEVLDLKKLVSNSFVSLGLSADVAEMAVS